MKNFLGPFQRLQWRLTLSYTLVTVVTIFVLAMVLVVVTNQMNASSPQYGTTLALALQDSTPQIASIFAGPNRDEMLQKWVDRTVTTNAVLLNNLEPADRNGISFASVTSQGTLLAIVDAQGLTLASNHAELELKGRPLAGALTPGAVELLQAALAPNPGQRLWRREGDQILAAAPVFDANQHSIGAVFLQFVVPDQLALIGIGLVSVLPMTLLVGIGAGMIGTFFGALNARSLTRRLENISRGTKAWGLGDFSSRIGDRSSDEIHQLAADLNRMADDLETLVQTRQDLAVAEERNRMSRDLHDSVKQQVFAIRMNLGAAKSLWERHPPEALEQLDAAIGLIGQAQHELNVLIHTLRPVQLEAGGLAGAILETAEAWERQSKIPIRCQFEGEGPLSPEVENALYRIAQEALANAARHSGASSIELALAITPGEISLQVCDDGHGFDPARPTPGFGLRSMRERAHALGGRLQVESGAAPGTCLKATFPRSEEA